MRIAMVDPSLFTLPYDVALAGALGRRGHEIVLHGRPLRSSESAPGAVTLRHDFYRLTERPEGRRLPRALRMPLKGLDHVASMLRLVKRLRRERPDVIHFQWLALPFFDAAVLRLLRAVAPLVLTVHDTRPFNDHPSAALQAWGSRGAIRSFAHLIVHTRQGEARLHELGISAACISLVPHGPLMAIRPRRRSANDFDTVEFLLFGKIKRYKGADLLLEAFAQLPAAVRATARVRIIGEACLDVEELRRQAMVLGIAAECAIEPRIVPETEFDAMFAANVVAVFPYREIEASGVLSLAMAHGTPIIASRIGSFAETLCDGVHGRLVPAGNVPALAAALQSMIDDAAFAAGCAAAVVDSAAAAVGWDEIADATERLYHRAIDARCAAPAHAGMPA